MEQIDKELIQNCIKQDRTAQNKLYKQYSGKMLTVCNRYSKNQEDAEDALVEGFVKVFEKMNTYSFEGSFEGWIRRIMVNTALEKHRKKQLKTKELIENYSSGNINLGNGNLNLKTFYKSYLKGNYTKPEVEEKIDSKKILNIIQQLPPKYNQIFNLFVFEGLKHNEIAKKLGISEGTSKSNLSDARKWLQKEMKKLYQIKEEQLVA